ncbi:MAG: FG-GAP-like repeat-containing protein [Kiritimatiellae bacterium]|nr:FG-GAP-like repeat-containing protein [Kiritimatiellia bacterium]
MIVGPLIAFILCLLPCIAPAANAQFTEAPAFLLGVTSPVAVAVGDLNSDGKPDLAISVRTPGANGAADRKNDRVDIFYQKAGTYAPPADTSRPVAYVTGIQIGDFDGDGTNDMAVLSSCSPLHIFVGGERIEKDHATGKDPNFARGGPIACRLNSKGLCDFLCGAVWFKWFGGDNFSRVSGYFHGPRLNDNIASQPADLNMDGVTDVILTPQDRKTIRLYYGPFMVQNVFAQDMSQYVELPTPLPFGRGLAVGDFNGDGRPDIAASSAAGQDPAGRKIFMFYQNAPIGFSSNATPSAVMEGICGWMAVVDVNRDGLDDLLVSDAGRDGIYLFLQKKGKPFAASVNEADQVVKTGGRDVKFVVADINGDGYPDLIVTMADNVKGFLNLGKTVGGR